MIHVVFTAYKAPFEVRFKTWEEADAFRESYVSVDGHERTAIIIEGPAQGRGEGE